MADESLRITEIFHSIQGESSWAGCPCTFVRLTGCHLRCRYCDTEYSFRGGERTALDEIVREVLAFPARLVEVTGGEPLLQPGVHPLTRRLLDEGCTVLLETSGACDISQCDPRVIRILDIKTPGSGESQRMLASNLDDLRPRDEVKFVITDRADYEWSRAFVQRHDLLAQCHAVLFSPVFEQRAGAEIQGCEGLSMRVLAQWILQDGLAVRMQAQLHKFIWDPQTRGV